MTVKVYELAHSGLVSSRPGGASLDAESLVQPEGIYTTMRTLKDARIPGLSGHLRRLVESFELLGRQQHVDLAAIRSALRTILQSEPLPARLRVTVPFDGVRTFVSIEPFDSYAPELYEQGASCTTARVPRETPRAKYTAFIAVSRPLIAQAPPEIHEILRTDPEGYILEGMTSNFFAVLAGELRTAADGVLEGITRSVLLKLAPPVLPVACRPVMRSDLRNLSEAFISSSGRGVMPVVTVDGIAVGAGIPGPVTQEIMKRYRRYLEDEAEAP